MEKRYFSVLSRQSGLEVRKTRSLQLLQHLLKRIIVVGVAPVRRGKHEVLPDTLGTPPTIARRQWRLLRLRWNETNKQRDHRMAYEANYCYELRTGNPYQPESDLKVICPLSFSFVAATYSYYVSNVGTLPLDWETERLQFYWLRFEIEAARGQQVELNGTNSSTGILGTTKKRVNSVD